MLIVESYADSVIVLRECTPIALSDLMLTRLGISVRRRSKRGHGHLLQYGIGGFLPAESGAESALFGHAAVKGLDGAESGVWQFDADIKQCRSYHVCITTHGIAQSVQYRPVA